jgi:protein-export membrane protein SecD
VLTLFPLIWLAVVVLALVALAVIRPNHHVMWLVVTILLIAISVWIALPTNPGLQADFDADGEPEISRRIDVRQGLDLAGGVRVLLQADVPDDSELNAGAMEEVRRIVEQRIDALGALEPVVQLRGERRLIVELPGYSDPDSAVDLIRETALLEFVDFGYNPPPEGSLIETDYDRGSAEQDTTGGEDLTGIEYHTAMTGEILQSADVTFDPNTSAPLVEFVLTTEGSNQFAEYTSTHSGQSLGIVLDGVLVSAPRIDEPITGGSGVITGQFTLEEATQLATQLRYGALPVPLRVESTSTVGPTLGQISVERSIQAGIIGIATVLLFMLIYYRLPGLAAALALITFTLLNFALYKLIPITMTLPAITGFLISVGTAVDGNILIFERMKEELRKGKRLEPAVEAGFSRAWTSIRDSNFSTIIICAVLYAFGTSFGAGAVRGFAVTLALGLVINLFTAVTVTRTFLHFILLPVDEQFVSNNRWLMGLPAKGAQNV